MRYAAAFFLALFFLFATPVLAANSSLENLQTAAEKGDATAQVALGDAYSERKGGVEQDMKEAVKWWFKAANQGNARAQYSVGMVYYVGIGGVKKDYKEAAVWLRKAADQGNISAPLYLKSIQGADQGDTNAQLRFLPPKTQEIMQSMKTPAAWRKLAKEGDAKAQAAVCLNEWQNKNVSEQDYAEIVRWCRNTAEKAETIQGETIVYQGIIGQMYEKGQGVKQDYTEAYFWLSLAAVHNNFENKGLLDHRNTVAKHLTSEQITAIKKRIEEWKSIPAADVGIPALGK